MITCAVTGSVDTAARNPAVPVTPLEIAASAAPSNAALVEKAAKIIEILGDHVATPTEARQMLGLGSTKR